MALPRRTPTSSLLPARGTTSSWIGRRCKRLPLVPPESRALPGLLVLLGLRVRRGPVRLVLRALRVRLVLLGRLALLALRALARRVRLVLMALRAQRGPMALPV